MSYRRVLPRDLFNESNLLKCYGRLWIILSEMDNHQARFEMEEVESFEVFQSSGDGSLFVDNLPLTVGEHDYRLKRPLNSREPWPLYADSMDDPDFEMVPVFDDEGNLTDEMLSLIRGKDEGTS